MEGRAPTAACSSDAEAKRWSVQSFGSESDVETQSAELTVHDQPRISKLLSTKTDRGEHSWRVNLVDTTNVEPLLPGALPDSEGCHDDQLRQDKDSQEAVREDMRRHTCGAPGEIPGTNRSAKDPVFRQTMPDDVPDIIDHPLSNGLLSIGAQMLQQASVGVSSEDIDPLSPVPKRSRRPSISMGSRLNSRRGSMASVAEDDKGEEHDAWKANKNSSPVASLFGSRRGSHANVASRSARCHTVSGATDMSPGPGSRRGSWAGLESTQRPSLTNLLESPFDAEATHKALELVRAGRSHSRISLDAGLRSASEESYGSDEAGRALNLLREPSMMSLASEASNISTHLRFKNKKEEALLAAEEAQRNETSSKKEEVVEVVLDCEVIYVRDVDVLSGTFRCKFACVLEWRDEKSTKGLPSGPVADRKKIKIPEVTATNALHVTSDTTSMDVLDPQNGLLRCRIEWTATIQMTLDMRLFPFDHQNLVVSLGMRARKDRNKCFVARSCVVQAAIEMQEWDFTGTHLECSTTEGRACASLGVGLRRVPWFHVGVMINTFALTSFTFALYAIESTLLYDRAKVAVGILFAQIVQKLSVENKLPKVPYATVFDRYVASSNILLVTVFIGCVAVASAGNKFASTQLEIVLAIVLSSIWLLGNAAFGIWSFRRLRSQGNKVTAAKQPSQNRLSKGSNSVAQIDPGDRCAQSPEPEELRPVLVDVHIWNLRDIDPRTLRFECNFSLRLEWLDAGAVGKPPGRLDAHSQRDLKPPEVTVINAHELNSENSSKTLEVLNSDSGHMSMNALYHGKLEVPKLDMRLFPFDTQQLCISLRLAGKHDEGRCLFLGNGEIEGDVSLAEWTLKTSFTRHFRKEGAGGLEFGVGVQRKARYYVLNVVTTMGSISSLNFLVFCVDILEFRDRAKIFMSLTIAFLLYKLSVEPHLPSVACATTLHRYVNSCHAMGMAIAFLSASIAVLAQLWPDKTRLFADVDHIVACALAFAWIAWHAAFAAFGRRALRSGLKGLNNPTNAQRNKTGFGKKDSIGSIQSVEMTVKRMASQNSNVSEGARSNTEMTYEDGLKESIYSEDLMTMNDFRNKSLRAASLHINDAADVVLLSIQLRRIRRVDQLSGTFECKFVAFLEWFDESTKGLEEGPLSNQPPGVDIPQVMIPNALKVQTSFDKSNCKLVLINSQSGHCQCQASFTVKLHKRYDLRRFPFDMQVLKVFMRLEDSKDKRRMLFLQCCEVAANQGLEEWEVVRAFAQNKSAEQGSISFGVVIRRSFRFYVLQMLTVCFVSSLVFCLHALDPGDFPSRGKVLSALEMIQVSFKLSVDRRLPKVAYATVFSRYLAVCQTLVFWYAILIALVANIEVSVGERKVIDLALGACSITPWIIWNLWFIRRHLCPHLKSARSKAEPKRQKSGLDAALQIDALGDEAVFAKLDSEEVFATDGDDEDVPVVQMESSPVDTQVALLRVSRKPQPLVSPKGNHETHIISLAVRAWLICEIDTVGETFDCQFLVYLEWFDDGAKGLAEAVCVPQDKCKTLKVPKLTLRNALEVHSMERDTSPIVVDSESGHVALRIQFHAKLSFNLDLRRFPFDAQWLTLRLQLDDSQDKCRVFGCKAFEIDSRALRLEGWDFWKTSSECSVRRGKAHATCAILLRRSLWYFVVNVAMMFVAIASLAFSVFVIDTNDIFEKQMVLAAVMLGFMNFRFSVEARTPVTGHLTPLERHSGACVLVFVGVQAVSISFSSGQDNETLRLLEILVGLFLGIAWIFINGQFALRGYRWRRDPPAMPQAAKNEIGTGTRMGSRLGVDEGSKDVTLFAGDGMLRPWAGRRPTLVAQGTMDDNLSRELTALEALQVHPTTGDQSAAVLSSVERLVFPSRTLSVGFKLWVVRNLDISRGTFDCKFRVFLEWVEPSAIGKPKGQKLKEVALPEVVIRNAVECHMLDKSSGPEVVNPANGHVACQILFQAVLRIEVDMSIFPFDLQWLSICLSLPNAHHQDGDRAFYFQYCDVEDQISLSEWRVHRPLHRSLAKSESQDGTASIMCGLVVSRRSHYYVVNIMCVLWMISSLIFTMYAMDLSLYGPRTKIVVVILSLQIVFRISIQRNLPQVSYPTAFDRYAVSCLTLWFTAVTGNVLFAALEPSAPQAVRLAEAVFVVALAIIWFLWNTAFCMRAWFWKRGYQGDDSHDSIAEFLLRARGIKNMDSQDVLFDQENSDDLLLVKGFGRQFGLSALGTDILPEEERERLSQHHVRPRRFSMTSLASMESLEHIVGF